MKEIVNRALFLDRDGVINVEKNYVYQVDEFEFIEGIFDLCTRAQNLGFKLVIITNQAGIGRGYYTEADFAKLTDWMLDQFTSRGVHIARVYHCPYHPTAGVGEYRKESFDRKPNPGMILKAKEELDLNLSRSVLVGDKDSDIDAGRVAGVVHNLKLLHGNGARPLSSDRLCFPTLHLIAEWFGRTFKQD